MRAALSVGCICAAVVTITAAQEPRIWPAWTAPISAERRVNPLNARPDTAAGGAKLFRARCQSCHGRDGSGTSRGPNLTTRRVQAQADGSLFWKISSGNTRTGMPAFSGLPELQRWQLVLFVRRLPDR